MTTRATEAMTTTEPTLPVTVTVMMTGRDTAVIMATTIRVTAATTEPPHIARDLSLGEHREGQWRIKNDGCW